MMLARALLLLLPLTASSVTPLESVLLGQDVDVPFTQLQKAHRIAVVADAQLDCSRCPADHGKIWIIHGRPGQLDIGAGQFISSAESWGIFTTLVGGWKDKNEPNLLLDSAIDSFPPEWIHACTLDGKGHVVVAAASDWPAHGFPTPAALKPLTSIAITAKNGRYLCLNSRGLIGLLAGIPQDFANDRGRLTWSRNLESGRLDQATAALDALPARLLQPAGAQDAGAHDALRARLGSVTDAMKADLARYTCQCEECDPPPEAPPPGAEPPLPETFGLDKQIHPDLLAVCRNVGKKLTALKVKLSELGEKKARSCLAFFPRWRTRAVRRSTLSAAPRTPPLISLISAHADGVVVVGVSHGRSRRRAAYRAAQAARGGRGRGAPNPNPNPNPNPDH